MYNFSKRKRHKSNTYLPHQNNGEEIKKKKKQKKTLSNTYISYMDALFRHQKGTSEKICLNNGKYFICR